MSFLGLAGSILLSAILAPAAMLLIAGLLKPDAVGAGAIAAWPMLMLLFGIPALCITTPVILVTGALLGWLKLGAWLGVAVFVIGVAWLIVIHLHPPADGAMPGYMASLHQYAACMLLVWAVQAFFFTPLGLRNG